MATFLEPKAYDSTKVYKPGDFIVIKNVDVLEYFVCIKAVRNTQSGSEFIELVSDDENDGL